MQEFFSKKKLRQILVFIESYRANSEKKVL